MTNTKAFEATNFKADSMMLSTFSRCPSRRSRCKKAFVSLYATRNQPSPCPPTHQLGIDDFRPRKGHDDDNPLSLTLSFPLHTFFFALVMSCCAVIRGFGPPHVSYETDLTTSSGVLFLSVTNFWETCSSCIHDNDQRPRICQNV